MRRYNHIIWDWNGTLLDDAWLCVEVINKILKKYGKKRLTKRRYLEIFGFPVIDYYRRLGFNFEREPFEKVATEFIEEYNSRRFECGLRQDADAVVRMLAESGIRQSVLSSYPQNLLVEIITHFNMLSYFEYVSGLDNHYAGGKVGLGLSLIDKIQTPAEDIALVGDTVHDYEVACKMGVGCILIPSGHQPRLKLEKCGVRVVSNLSEVVSFLNK